MSSKEAKISCNMPTEATVPKEHLSLCTIHDMQRIMLMKTVSVDSLISISLYLEFLKYKGMFSYEAVSLFYSYCGDGIK
jgi:hypothetical protein